MPSYTTTIPESYDRARPHLIGFAIYVCIAALLLLFAPHQLLESPMLGPIEKLTGLPHLSTPRTLPEKQFLTLGGAFGSAIALIYTFQAGPAWGTTGRQFLEASVLTRLGFASVIWGICFLSPYGNSFALSTSVLDTISALMTMRAMGVSFPQLLTGRRPIDKKV